MERKDPYAVILRFLSISLAAQKSHSRITLSSRQRDGPVIEPNGIKTLNQEVFIGRVCSSTSVGGNDNHS